MKRLIRIPLLIATISMLVACSGTKIDGENKDTFSDTTSQIMKELEQADALQFERDVQAIAEKIFQENGGMTIANLENPAEIEDQLMSMLDGKTAAGVREMAEEIRSN